MITPDEWVRQWGEMLDRRQPGWQRGHDREAFELAVRDLFGEQAPDPGSPELLAEYALRYDEEAPKVYAEAASSGRFRRALIEFEYIFRASHGSSRDCAELRELRRRAAKGLIEAVLEPLSRRFERMERAERMRERRRARRERPVGDASWAPAAGTDPDGEALAREAAARVAARLRDELSPGALRALRRFLLDPAAGPACGAAEAAGVSPATMTRALRRVGALAAEELTGCPEEVFRPFAEALVQALQ